MDYEPLTDVYMGGMKGSGSMTQSGKGYFPDPWCDYASTEAPKDLSTVLKWAEFLWMSNGTYRMACQRVVRYFLTSIEVADVADEEAEKYSEVLTDVIGAIDSLSILGDDLLCFHGDVRAVTRDGVFRLRDLAGTTADVLSEGGVYRPAEFKSFGRQRLLEVELTDGRTIKATPEHQWIVKGMSGKPRIVPTSALRPGHRLPRTVAPRPERNEGYFEGVRHGFVFGDGSLYNGGRQAAAAFFGDKIKDMLPYFEGHGCPPRPYKGYTGETYFRVHGLPAAYKRLPEISASASYWYGFVSGFLAADGTVDKHGCAMLTQKSKSVLDRITEQLPRIGMVAGPVRGHESTRALPEYKGKQKIATSVTHFVTLLKQNMLEQDFIRPHHLKNFKDEFKKTNYGKYVAVKSVRDTGVIDEVFCCVEPETHTLVIENGVLTKNCYGNSLSSLFVPFDRYLQCTACNYELPIDRLEFQFTNNFEFKADCPSCHKKKVKFTHRDRRNNAGRMRIIRWSPHNMIIEYNPMSHDATYRYRLPEELKRKIKEGDKFLLRTTPWEVITAVKDDKLFRFHPDKIFHMKEDALAGLTTVGWGLPRMMSIFKQAYYIQVLKRYNEALGMDYIVPLRVATPAASSKEGDPMLQQNLGSVKGKFLSMIKEHRKDPATWHFLPFPIQYQALGMEGMQMSTHELIDTATDEMLNATGIPAELYRGSLQIQAAPMALRLFQQTWPQLISGFNHWLTWLVRQVAAVRNWEPATAKLTPVTLADDLEKKQVLLQLAAGNQVSRQTAFAPWGIDTREERDRIYEEQSRDSEAEKEFQKKEQERAALEEQIAAVTGPGAAPGGMPAQGGMPPQGGAPSGMHTPQDMMMQAEQMAGQLLQMPEPDRKRQLSEIKKSDEALHALVMSKIRSLRQDAQQQGGQMLLQQQGPMPPMPG